uniref:Putative zc3h12a-like ribonuclease nyn domain protein n=1 Tax=Culex tarsalis TaxID=7177 RepID=A0A1Q3F1F0_CULTA
MSRNKKRQSVGRTPRKAGRTPKVTKPKLVIDLRGRKDRTRKLMRKQILGDRKRTSNNNNGMLKGSSSHNNMILYPPVPPPPAPGRASKGQRKNQQRPQQRKFDCIVIDSEDDEGVGQEAIPSFYEDRTGGFDDRDVPLYVSHCGDVQDTLEEGEIRDDEVDLNKAIVNVESISVRDNGGEDDDEVIQVDDSIVTERTVPMPKYEDQSVIFCSEVIDLSRAVDRNKLLDFIPIGYDRDPAEARQRSPRKKSKKPREEKQQQEQPEAGQKDAAPANGDARSAKRMVVIDGNNVAYAHTVGQAFSVKGLEICIEYFKRMGHNVKAVVPQFRLKRDKCTDPKKLDDMHKAGDILLAPSKNLPGQRSSTYDDRLILSVAEKFDGVIISNDNFRDLLTVNDSWKKIIETRVIGYTWVMDEFFLPDDPYGRHGPKLKELLEQKTAAAK